MADCCKHGSFHKGTPVGTETVVADLPTYVTGSPEARVAVLLVSDIYGWRLNNTRILADKYAAGIGARVYVPDFFDGHAPDAQMMADPAKKAAFDLPAFIARFHPRDAARPRVTAVVNAIRASGATRVAAVGFCWGAPSALFLAQDAVDAIAFAHPSLAETDDFTRIRKPALFLTAESDPYFDDDKRTAAINATNRLAKEHGTWVYYPNTTHGFAVRGDEGDAYTARVMQDAANSVISHFRAELLA